jgi:hypothetical protein
MVREEGLPVLEPRQHHSPVRVDSLVQGDGGLTGTHACRPHQGCTRTKSQAEQGERGARESVAVQSSIT